LRRIKPDRAGRSGTMLAPDYDRKI
jgi:hypothetical protein